MILNDFEITAPIRIGAQIPSAGAMTNGDMIVTLNKLIETCKRCREVFKMGAENVERSDLKSFLHEYYEQRSQFVEELKALVQTLGGDPEDPDSFDEGWRRGWTDLKSDVAGKDQAAILDECERNEDSAKNLYKMAAQERMPGYVHDVIIEQLRALLKAHDRIKALRDAANRARSSATG